MDATQTPASSDKELMGDAGDPNEDLLKSYLSNEQSHPGSSKKGRVFDFGPRQFPTIEAPQSIKLKTPITSCNSDASHSLSVGFSYLHSFQVLEAERYFRLALYQDNKCTMSLWAAALSQIIFGVGDLERGLKFAKLSILLTQNLKLNLSDLEKKLQNILSNYLENPNPLESKKTFVSLWFSLVKEYPKELELKALGALLIWQYELIPVLGYTQKRIDDLIQEVLSIEPKHPVHHTRIHLWNDGKNEYRALDSAEKIGSSFLNSAHMWHMGSHIYSMTRRSIMSEDQYLRASYLDQLQQKNSLDFPFVIHNYAHNQHYWTYNASSLGRFNLAKDIAIGLLELPKHPKYNNPLLNEGNLGIYRSAFVAGVDALIGLSKNYAVIDPLLEAADNGQVPVNFSDLKDQTFMLKLLFHLSWGYALKGEESQSTQYKLLIDLLLSRNPELGELGSEYQKALNIISKWVHGDMSLALVDELNALNQKNKFFSSSVIARFYRRVHAPQKSLEVLGDLENNSLSDLNDLLEASHAHASLENTEIAKFYFSKAYELSSYLDRNSDQYKLGLSILSLIGEKIPLDWRKSVVPRPLELSVPENYTGERYALPTAPSFSLKNAQGKVISLEETLTASKKGVVLVFVLGGSCLRCNQQLMKLNEEKMRLEHLGYTILAVTTDTEEDLKFAAEIEDSALTEYELLSNSSLDVFKAYKAHDDFESLPLHGTFVISKNKSLRFIDRGALPFEDIDFLVKEIKRLDKIQVQ